MFGIPSLEERMKNPGINYLNWDEIEHNKDCKNFIWHKLMTDNDFKQSLEMRCCIDPAFNLKFTETFNHYIDGYKLYK